MADKETPDFGEVLNALMANPEAVSGIMDVLKNSGIHFDAPEKAEFHEKEPTYEGQEETQESLSSFSVDEEEKRKPGKRERDALIQALLPYLPYEERKRLKEILRIADLLMTLKKGNNR